MSELGDRLRERADEAFGETPAGSAFLEAADMADDYEDERLARPRAGRWRVGRKVGRTLYLNDELVGVMDTPELAAMVVAALEATSDDMTRPDSRTIRETFPGLYRDLFTSEQLDSDQ